jgi:hypothetical protein
MAEQGESCGIPSDRQLTSHFSYETLRLAEEGAGSVPFCARSTSAARRPGPTSPGSSV